MYSKRMLKKQTLNTFLKNMYLAGKVEFKNKIIITIEIFNTARYSQR